MYHWASSDNTSQITFLTPIIFLCNRAPALLVYLLPLPCLSTSIWLLIFKLCGCTFSPLSLCPECTANSPGKIQEVPRWPGPTYVGLLNCATNSHVRPLHEYLETRSCVWGGPMSPVKNTGPIWECIILLSPLWCTKWTRALCLTKLSFLMFPSTMVCHFYSAMKMTIVVAVRNFLSHATTQKSKPSRFPLFLHLITFHTVYADFCFLWSDNCLHIK